MPFDMTQPITFSFEEAGMQRVVAWQALIELLMQETDTFMIGSVRQGQDEPEMSHQPAITLLLIAEQDEMSQPVGISSIADGELGIAILQQFQGAGLGQASMDTLIDWAQQMSLESLWLDVQTDNQVAIHLYQKYDFKNVGEVTAIELPNGRKTELQRMLKVL
ncbi:GNAT family N-acetyltransferase [Leuconostoc carnosum]|uniref:GNAT family acetyltransferase n=2 Tax=Leuconostoc carnosum TaxID=1252 RepID=K0DEF2_LEUCJ|nr:GNAT family N-acetyltransferase [Leuconostoc carnosum]AFT82012.1 GNAT family acetyltransferase [Leuconostoc carnosum JB16]KAA8328582.1 GNAT family N-acetyltransferase [Leuconostoc carnosum]QEA33941.1 GNAT family N-acetyltransferase [Leuconostoc carnosum]